MPKLQRILVGVAGLVLSLFALVTLAAEPAPKPNPPAAAPASKEAEPAAAKFYPFLGNWRGTGELREAGKPAVPLTVHWRCRKAAQGWAVSCDLNARGGEVHIGESDLMGVDPVTGQLHWYAITNQGETHDHIVQWTNAKTMTARFGWNQGGKKMEENVKVSVPDEKTVEYRSVVTENGKEVASFSGKLERFTPSRREKGDRQGSRRSYPQRPPQ